MLARSASDARAITSAAVGPSWPIRMSSGPSRRNEKPRSASSSCIEDTPTSITTPSTAATPCAAQISARLENRSSTSVSRPSDRSTRSNPPAMADAVAVDADDAGSGDIENRPAVAAGPEGGVDIDAAVAGREHRRRPRGRGRGYGAGPAGFMPRLRARSGLKLRKLDANGPIAPQISALRRAFPPRKAPPQSPTGTIAAPVRPQIANPDFPMEFAGLPWDFERQTGPRPSPKPVRLFTT